MRLKLDENLGHRIAKIFRLAGHDVSTVPDQRLQGATDWTVIEACRRERRCLVTLDLGFGNPLVFNPSGFHGIVIFRLPARSLPEDWDDVARTVLGGLERESVAGQLWIVQRGRIRQYRPDADTPE